MKMVYFQPAKVLMTEMQAAEAFISATPVVEVHYAMRPVFTDAPVPSLRTEIKLRGGLSIRMDAPSVLADREFDQVTGLWTRILKGKVVIRETTPVVVANDTVVGKDGTVEYTFFTDDFDYEGIHTSLLNDPDNPFLRVLSLPINSDGAPLVQADTLDKLSRVIVAHARSVAIIANAGESVIVVNSNPDNGDSTLPLDQDGDPPDAAASTPSITTEQLQAERVKLTNTRENLLLFFEEQRVGQLQFMGSPDALLSSGVVPAGVVQWLDDQGVHYSSLADTETVRELMNLAFVAC